LIDPATPARLKVSRKRRIAMGADIQAQEVNRLLNSSSRRRR